MKVITLGRTGFLHEQPWLETSCFLLVPKDSWRLQALPFWLYSYLPPSSGSSAQALRRPTAGEEASPHAAPKDSCPGFLLPGLLFCFPSPWLVFTVPQGLTKTHSSGLFLSPRRTLASLPALLLRYFLRQTPRCPVPQPCLSSGSLLDCPEHHHFTVHSLS